MNAGDREFRIRPGRIKSTRARKPKSFINRVLHAANMAGHVSPARRAAGRRHSTFGRGRISFGRERLFNPARRVTVKARVVRHRGRAFRSAPLAAHLSYLKRDGVTRSGEPAHMFDAGSDRADEVAFEALTRDDRHHFRFIVSPEDAGDMIDLKAFTRDLMRQMEANLATPLSWVAALGQRQGRCPHAHSRSSRSSRSSRKQLLRAANQG